MSSLVPLVLAAAFVAPSWPAAAQQRPGASAPAAVVTHCDDITVGAVHVVRNEIFNEDQATSWLYRTVNNLHVLSRDGVVRRELLLEEGAVLDLDALAQSERNLRAQSFLAEARIDLLTPGGELIGDVVALATTGGCASLSEYQTVDVRTTTRDSWSTTLEGTLRKAGDRWIWGVGLEESNLLGRGKSLEIGHRDDLDRTTNLIIFRDPRLLGSRVVLRAEYDDESDGSRFAVEVGQPFFSLDSLWTFQTRVESFDQTMPIYRDGDEIERLRWLRQRQEVGVSRLVRRSGDSALRFHVAYRSLYEDVGVEQRDFGFVQVGLSSVQHRYLKLAHLNHERPEDVNLGAQSTLWFGVSTPAFGGGPDTALYLEASHNRGVRLGDSSFLLARLEWKGRVESSLVENGLGEARLTAVARTTTRGLALASVQYLHGTRLDPEIQLRLGSHNGLRGYPVNQWVGDRSLLASAEHRWFIDDDVLRLASIGAAVFVDTGYAWPESQRLELRDLRTSVGVALLIGRKQLSTNRAGMRIDLAYALREAEGRGRWILSFGTAVPIGS